MAEEKKKPEPAPEKHDAPPKSGLLTRTPVLVGVVMLLEAVVLFAGFKFLIGAGPAPVAGAELVEAGSSGEGGHGESAGGHGEAADGHGGASAPGDKNRPVEIPLIDMKAPNKRDGRTFIYSVKMVVVTRGDNAERVKSLIKEREALIRDRIRTIIAQSDPDRLGGGKEPGLETLRRQVKYQLDEIIGEGVIDEVLVPDCIPFRADF